MASPVSMPADAVARICRLGRELRTMADLLRSRNAERLGLSDTDHRCLDLAARADEPLTAGQIARLSGMSTGAVTGVIDRLEGRGLVRRARDPGDRRKVLVEVAGTPVADADHVTERVLTRFTPDEWEVIERYTHATLEEHRRLLDPG
jgi:DNA-binding transcriptional regulator GbsR (MarR family)